ncbi:MAG: cell division protein FtsX [Acidocella sp.]|nr:cell division protein FtsX [Acidocella sp.]
MMANHPPRRRADYLGLRTALADRLLPVLVGAMSFLAALAVGGTLACATLAMHWQGDTTAALTIQVPQPQAPDAANKGPRLAAVQAALASTPGIASPQLLSDDAVNKLLAPWLGTDVAQLGLPMPAVISAHWTGAATPDALATTLQKLSPGTLVQSGAMWAARVAALTTSLQACAAAVLIIVALVAAAVVAVATRSGLAQRRETITIIHGLGALDADIANRFAARATLLTLAGGLGGTVLALPVLAWLATLAAPFAGPAHIKQVFNLPPALWFTLPVLPIIAGLIGWSTAQLTVRGWLRTLP